MARKIGQYTFDQCDYKGNFIVPSTLDRLNEFITKMSLAEDDVITVTRSYDNTHGYGLTIIYWMPKEGVDS